MPNRELFLEASVTQQLVGRIVDEQLRGAGIPGYLLALLTHVRDNAPVSPSEVSHASGVPLTTLRDNVQRLVDRGLVRRVPHPHDGRSYRLVPTAKGRAVATEAGAALLAAYLALEERLPRSRSHYERVLAELNGALRETLLELEGASHAPSGHRPAGRGRAPVSAARE